MKKVILNAKNRLKEENIHPECSIFDTEDFLGVFENANLNITISSKKDHFNVYILVTRKHFVRMPKFLDSVGRLKAIIKKMPKVKKLKIEEIE